MGSVYVAGFSEGRYRVDVCRDCGGLWFDRLELGQLDFAEAKRLARQMPSPPKAALSGRQYCPRCLVPLGRTTLTYEGRQVPVEVCSRCRGTFVDPQAFADYVGVLEGLKEARLAVPAGFSSVKRTAVGLVISLLVIMPLVAYGLRERVDIWPRAGGSVRQLSVVNVDSTAVYIVWRTDVAATSKVEYGFTVELELIPREEMAFSKTHQVKLDGLGAGATYYFRVSGQTSRGEIITGEIDSFTVKAD